MLGGPLGEVGIWAPPPLPFAEVTASDLPVFLPPPVREQWQAAVARTAVRLPRSATMLARGVPTRDALAFHLWLETAAALGIGRLLQRDGSVSPLSRYLPAPASPPPYRRAPAVGLAMIAQDEEERISRALESVAGWVQQMVVVDGGSRDGTARLAESFGAEVVERPFDGDFSTQRNVAVRALSTPWVLSLDADEVVSAGLPSLLDHIAASGDVDGVWIPFLNLLDDDPVPWLWPDRKLRFFRSGHHYVNRIHERVAGLGRLAWLPMNGPSIRHHKTLEQQWDRERQYFEMDPSWYSPADAERIRRRIERMDDGSPPGQ